MTYADKLKSPKWQKKRLEILERDEWECLCCGSNEKTLHVHHRYYEKDKEPWDYPDESLYCFCDDCHNEYTIKKKEINRLIKSISPFDYSRLIGYLTTMHVSSEYYMSDENIVLQATDSEFIIGMSDFLTYTETEIYDMIKNNGYNIEFKKLLLKKRKN